MKRHICVLIIALTCSIGVQTRLARAQDMPAFQTLPKPSDELKATKIRRDFERCLKTYSNSECARYLEQLHAIETVVLSEIARHAEKYPPDKLNKAFSHCNSANKGFKTTVKCWEDLAQNMAQSKPLGWQKPPTHNELIEALINSPDRIIELD